MDIGHWPSCCDPDGIRSDR